MISKLDIAAKQLQVDKFQINKVYGGKDYHPAAQLVGIDSHFFWGEKQNALG